MDKLESLMNKFMPQHVLQQLYQGASTNCTPDTPGLKYFTPEQLFQFLDLPISTPFATLVKAAVCLAFCGQLGGFQLKSLQLEDFVEESDGLVVYLNRSGTQRKGSDFELLVHAFVIPLSIWHHPLFERRIAGASKAK